MRAAWLLGLVACGGTPSPVDETDDTDPVVVDCARDAAPTIAFGPMLGQRPMEDGDDVGIGVPPQGGSPYAPLEVRIQGDAEDLARMPVHIALRAVGTDELLGEITETRAFVCANVGVHGGWLYGGEVHARFPGKVQADLDGAEVNVTVTVTLPDTTTVEGAHAGTLRWTLGSEGIE